MIRLYVKEELSCEKIGNIFDLCAEIIRRRLKEYNIPARKSWTKGAGWNKGRKHPVSTRINISKGLLKGKQKAPVEYGNNWKYQRKLCLERDEHTCQQCYSNNLLEVHHWEPYRFSFDNSLDNLVTLCRDCHKDMHRLYKREGFIQQYEYEFYN